MARTTAAAIMLWPAAAMGAVSVAALLDARPESVPMDSEAAPPDMVMGLLISLGLASAALLLATVVLALSSLHQATAWKTARWTLLGGYLTGSAAGLVCYFIVGGGADTADRGLELFGRYQLAGVAALTVLAIARLARHRTGLALFTDALKPQSPPARNRRVISTPAFARVPARPLTATPLLPAPPTWTRPVNPGRVSAARRG
ncbi:hypothetical protein GCM10027589_22630 [Actinocorallia lasiicapitis]